MGKKADKIGRVRPVAYKKSYHGGFLGTGVLPAETQNEQNLDCLSDVSNNLSEAVSFDNFLVETVLHNCRQNPHLETVNEHFKLPEEKWHSNDSDNESDFLEEKPDIEDHNLSEKDSESESITPGHWLPLKISVLLIWMYAINYGISGTQMTDLLQLINLHLAVAHPALSSLYKFKNYFSKLAFPAGLQKHYYCSFCFAAVEENQEKCKNSFCLASLKDKKNKGYFISVSVEEQLKKLFQRQDFKENIKAKYKRIKKNNNNIEDIYDGELYKKLSEPGGVLSSDYPLNVSFTINTDGIPIFKSSKMSIWPVFLMINELPFDIRKCSENMLIAGLWFGEQKPFMYTFTEPLHRDLQKLENEGLEVVVDGQKCVSKAFLICLTADLPAKSAFLNTIQFNGEYSCAHCLQKGSNFRTPKGGNVHIFPYIADKSVPERNDYNFKSSALRAYNENLKSSEGVKGPSFFMTLRNFDCVKSIAIDYMHCICLGVTKLLTRLWFAKEFANTHFSLHSKLELVDERLSNIKPCKFVSRLPRSIKEHLGYWKAAEFRSWLFYYSVPILSDLMESVYMYHYMALVESLSILCSNSINACDLERSERCLKYFVFMFKDLYGEKFLTLNIHLLLHLTMSVKILGPLWAFSCFPFENANGEILKLFHGTQFIDVQIVNAVNIIKTLPAVLDSVQDKKTVYDFSQKMLKKRGKNIGTKIDYKIIGAKCKVNLCVKDKEKLILLCNEALNDVHFYSRACIRGVVYHSRLYSRVIVRNSFTVKFFDDSGKLCFGFIEWFAEVQQNKLLICCVHKLKNKCINILGSPDKNEVIENFLNVKIKHLHCFEVVNSLKDEDVCIVKLENVLNMCNCIKMENSLYIAENVNDVELNL